MNVLILGAGGHGQVVAETLLCAHRAGQEAIPIGFLDDDRGLCGQTRLGLPILGSLAQLEEVDHDAVIIAIGDNRERCELYEQLDQQGEQVATVVHPSAIIAADAKLGPGSMVCAGVIVNTGVVIGACVILNTGCTVGHHNHIGDHVHVGPGTNLGGDVTIGKGALIGIGAAILPQRKVGEWSIVGGGAAVAEDIPAGVTAVGVPARAVANRSIDP